MAPPAACTKGPDLGGVNMPAMKNTAVITTVKTADQNPSLLTIEFNFKPFLDVVLLFIKISSPSKKKIKFKVILNL